MEEQFATFDCMETFAGNCCEFRLVSQIPWMDHYAWAIFNSHDVSIVRGDVNRRSFSKQTYVSQAMSFELLKDFGYFQLICIPEKIVHDGIMYRQYELLTFMAYRDIRVKKSLASPHLITICPEMNTTYVPMVPGQCIQLICPDSDKVENDDVLSFIPGTKKSFSLGGKGRVNRLQSVTYRCESDEGGVTYIDNKSLIIPRLLKQDDEAFIKILKPIDDFDVYVEGIDYVFLECFEGVDNWLWDEDYFDVESSAEGIYIRLKKPLKSISVILGRKVSEVIATNTLGIL